MPHYKVDELIKTAGSYRKIIPDYNNIIGSGITLTNNEIKDIMKVIKSLRNREISLKGTAKKITSQEGGFLSFLRSLMTAGLPLIKVNSHL